MSTATVLGGLCAAAALPGCAYLAALTAGSLRTPRRLITGDVNGQRRVVIVVPAHNESMALLRTLRSLRREVLTDPLARIVVIADNCSDDTADVALAAGVDVLERQDPARRGKGYALRFAFDAITEADWFIVIDADSEVEPGFLRAMRAAMTPDADALQCRYGVRDALSSPRLALAEVAFGAWNVLRPRGREGLGLSVGILGNGFALSRRTLQAVPYTAASIVEDVEYHHLLVAAGLRVRWVDPAQVRGEMPLDREAAGQQRARWEGGRLRLLTQRLPGLLAQAAAGRWRLLDPVLDLLLWPLTWLVSLLLVALATGPSAAQGLALAGLFTVGVHVAVSLRLIRAGTPHLRALLLGAPAHLAWKLTLGTATWRAARRHAAWVRTHRNPA